VANVDGSTHFHRDFMPKPTVIVGAYGMMPEKYAEMGHAEVGDLIVAVGGRTGRDGIHGATMSSAGMDETTAEVSGSAVQIGNPIEEKRMNDAILAARDKDLITAITDCGAAGFSSAIGEMGEEVGARVDLANAPLKYTGLAPWEIWMSESQERMVLAIKPEHIDEFIKTCSDYNTEAAVLGEFDGSQRLTVTHGGTPVVDLDYDFLNNGLPQREMVAKWEKPMEELEHDEIVPPQTPEAWKQLALDVMGHWNICSKEAITRQYDHTVQGRTVTSSYLGVHQDGPSDGVVMTPIRGERVGFVAAHGLNPILNRIDPYEGSLWAVAEAMSNYVSAGGDPDQSALINNWIGPVPDEQNMGALDMSVDAVCDSMDALERPVISGKDSLSSTYENKQTGEIIEVPLVLCMSVFGKTPDVEKVVTPDLKEAGTRLYQVGATDDSLGGSIYHDLHGVIGTEGPKVDMEDLPRTLRAVHQAQQAGLIMSCHDISEGGVMAAVTEMGFGGDLGAILEAAPGEPVEQFLYQESAGRLVLEVAEEHAEEIEELFGWLECRHIGYTTEKREIEIECDEEEVFTATLDELKEAWQRRMPEVMA
jgi:phosphoribosylformylglycinamidine synthase II